MEQNQRETIKQLEKQIEHAKKHAKEEAKEHKEFLATNLRIALNNKFAKTDAKNQDKVEKLTKELEVIASQKQTYGQ